MTFTPNARGGAAPASSPDVTWPRMLRLGALGLASDIRDRRREPSLRKRPTARALDPRLHRPIFIIGAPRSGTTFLGSCIGRMPDVSYHLEPRLTKAAARCVYDGSWSERRSAAVFKISYSALLLAALDGGRRFAEKNPENGFVVPFLAAALPAAQFVHIIRDGRDATVSHAEQPWLAASSGGRPDAVVAGSSGGRTRGGGWSLTAAKSSPPCLTWCDLRGAGGGSPPPHWPGWLVCPAGRMLELRYESVVRDPAGTAELLAGFLETSPAGLAALQAGLAKAKTSSVGRWRDVLTEPEIADVNAEIGPLLSRLGYT